MSPRSSLGLLLVLGAFAVTGCAGKTTSDNPPGDPGTQAAASQGGNGNGNGTTSTPASTAGCDLDVDDSHYVHFDGICIPASGPMVADATSIFVLEQTSPPAIVKIDRATNAATTLVGRAGTSDPVPRYTLTSEGDDILFDGCTSTTSCGIYAVSRQGGDPRLLASIDPQAIVSSIAADASFVYFFADRDLMSVGRSGASLYTVVSNAVILTRGRPHIALAPGVVYFTSPDDGVVFQVYLNGTGLQSTAYAIATGEGAPTEIFVEGSSAYWLDHGTLGVDCAPTDGRVRVYQGNGVTKDVLINIPGGTGLSVSAGRTVVSTTGAFCNRETAGGSIQELSQSASAPVLIAQGLLGASGATIVGERVLWTVSSGYDGKGVIMEAPLQ